MSKLRIFIEGKELDSLESVTVPITKQFEELSDPTVICNDYSKTVTVPLSKNNNEIFGHCYNPDRLIATSTDQSTPLVGIYFDPYKKLDCRLQWGDDVFFTGYAKMMKVTNKGYEVTINGELGKIFQELQKISFQKSDFESDEDIEKYWIDGSKYVDTVINKELVYKCWNSQQDDYTLREVTDSNYDITDIIGFIPNNSYSSDFDYTTVELTNGTSKSIEDYLGEDFETNTGYSRDSVIGDGLLPVCMYQYRSYEQIPFIYWNKFWQIFQKKSEELTGYSWDLDKSWFFGNNKNFNGLGITLLQRDSLGAATDSKTDNNFSITLQANTLPISKGSTTTLTSKLSGDSFVSGDKLIPGDGQIKIRLNVKLNLSFTNTSDYTATSVCFAYNEYNYKKTEYLGGILVKCIYNNNTLAEWGICDNSSYCLEWMKNKNPNAQIVGLSNQTVSVKSGESITIPLVLSEETYIICDTVSDYLYFTIEPWFMNIVNEPSPVSPIYFGTENGYYPSDSVSTLYSSQISSGSDANWQKTLFRSGSKFTLNDICNFDFSNILDYCKRFRINIYTDEVNKKLKFSKSLFSDYTIIDKTDQIDTSTFEVSPINFDDKYVLLGYKETETQIGQAYKNLYKYPYGSKRLATDYNFNTETNTLFEKSCESILYSPSSLNWFDISSNKYKKWQLIFWVLNNNYLECRGDDGKTVDVSGSYFYPTRVEVDHQYEETSPWITDDSDNQKLIDNYYNYANTSPSAYGVISYYWTSPELVARDTSTIPTQYFTCLFDKPKKNYVAEQNYFDKVSSTVYSSFWKEYINERYNVQNKKVTTYVRLSPIEFINFDFNQFWKIDNQIYIVNKIYDYDITSDKPVKVDLITVQNIDAYKS